MLSPLVVTSILFPAAIFNVLLELDSLALNVVTGILLPDIIKFLSPIKAEESPDSPLR